MPVKLYIGEGYRQSDMGHIPLLYPFWGIVAKDTMPYAKAALEKHTYETAAGSFTLVSNIAEADFVVIPHPYWRLRTKHPEVLSRIEEEARRAGKLVFADASGDIAPHVEGAAHFVLRTSAYRYSLRSNEYMAPLAAEDLLQSYCGGELALRAKSERPSVGFTGWGRQSRLERLKTIIKELPLTLASFVDRKRRAEHKGVWWRGRVLSALAATKGIETRFIVRGAYAGHVSTAEGSIADNRREFVQNLLDTDYALVVRGDGNTSYRLYEALSLGRIPLMLNTACVLPLEDRIPYAEFCVFVDSADTSRIGKILLDFHAQVSTEDFQRMQQQARAAFSGYLRQDVFLGHLARAMDVYAKRYYEKAPSTVV